MNRFYVYNILSPSKFPCNRGTENDIKWQKFSIYFMILRPRIYCAALHKTDYYYDYHLFLLKLPWKIYWCESQRVTFMRSVSNSGMKRGNRQTTTEKKPLKYEKKKRRKIRKERSEKLMVLVFKVSRTMSNIYGMSCESFSFVFRYSV